MPGVTDLSVERSLKPADQLVSHWTGRRIFRNSFNHSLTPGSVVIAGLKKIDGFVGDAVHQAMFLRDAP
jgi:hypothetical protein